MAEEIDSARAELPVFSETEITAMRLADDAEGERQSPRDLFVGIERRRGSTFAVRLAREVHAGAAFYRVSWSAAVLEGDELDEWLDEKTAGACAVGFDPLNLSSIQRDQRFISIFQNGTSLTPALREISLAVANGRLHCWGDPELESSIAEAKVVPSAAGESNIVDASPQFRALVIAMAASLRSQAGILSCWPPPRQGKVSTQRNFITGNPSRFIEYEDGRDEAARIALHEEVAG